MVKLRISTAAPCICALRDRAAFKMKWRYRCTTAELTLLPRISTWYGVAQKFDIPRIGELIGVSHKFDHVHASRHCLRFHGCNLPSVGSKTEFMPPTLLFFLACMFICFGNEEFLHDLEESASTLFVIGIENIIHDLSRCVGCEQSRLCAAQKA